MPLPDQNLPHFEDRDVLRVRMCRVRRHIALLARACALPLDKAAQLIEPQLHLFALAAAAYAFTPDKRAARALLFARDCAIEAKCTAIISSKRNVKRTIG